MLAAIEPAVQESTGTSTANGLATTDLVILVAYMLAMVAFGMWIGRGQKSGDDYMAGGRNLPWWALLVSIVATETSTVTFLSAPALGFGGGIPGSPGNLTFLQLPMGYVIGRLLVSWILMPLYFRGNVLTAYQVLQERFGTATRRTASFLFMVTRTLADGLRLLLTAYILQALTGFSMTESVIALGVATILYTFAGGMKAVVWTDFIQFIVYMGGAALAFWLLLDELPGGWGDVVALADAEDKFRVFDFTLAFDEVYVFWAGLIGGAVLSVGTHGVDQIIVQRFLCSRSLGDARKALLGSAVVVSAQFAFFLLLGVALYTFYRQNPPATPFTKGDQVFATFIVDQLPTGVLGIVVGAVFSSAMSTLSSSINSSATAAVNDFYLPIRGLGSEHPDALRMARVFTVLFGILQICVGVSGIDEKSPIIGSVLAIAGFTTGIILGVFLLGLLGNTRVGRRIAGPDGIAGITVGAIVMSAIKFGIPGLLDPLPIAWPWFALLGASLTTGAGLISAQLRNR